MKQLLSAGLMLGILVLVGCAPSNKMTNPGESTSSNQVNNRQYVYVCNQSSASVSIIDIGTLEIVDTVDLGKFGFDKNAKPHHIVAESDGSHWYVSLIGAGRVLKFNRANELVGQAEYQAPGMLSLHPTDDLLFVGRSMMAVNPPQRIGMIERGTMDIEELDVFFPRPHALAVDPRGDYVYSASLAVNQFLSMNIDTGETHLFDVEGDPHTFVQFALSPDGKTMVVGAELTGTVFIFDTTNPDEVNLLGKVAVNAAPWHPVFSSDGRFAYFGNKRANTVTVLDVKNRKVAAVIEGEGLSQPHGIALSPDGKRLFVSNNNLAGGGMKMGGENHAGHTEEMEDQPGTLVVINTETNSIEKVIELGFYPSGMGTWMRQ